MEIKQRDDFGHKMNAKKGKKMNFELPLTYKQKKCISKALLEKNKKGASGLIIEVLFSGLTMLSMILPVCLLFYTIVSIIRIDSISAKKIIPILVCIYFYCMSIFGYYVMSKMIYNQGRFGRTYILRNNFRCYVVKQDDITDEGFGYCSVNIMGKDYHFNGFCKNNNVISFNELEPLAVIPYIENSVIYMSVSTIDSRYSKMKYEDLKEFAEIMKELKLSEEEIDAYFEDIGIGILDNSGIQLDKVDRAVYAKKIYKHFYFENNGRSFSQEIAYRIKEMFDEFKTGVLVATALGIFIFVFVCLCCIGSKSSVSIAGIFKFSVCILILVYGILLAICIYRYFLKNEYAKAIYSAKKCNIYKGTIECVKNTTNDLETEDMDEKMYNIKFNVGYEIENVSSGNHIYVYPNVKDGIVDVLVADSCIIVMQDE